MTVHRQVISVTSDGRRPSFHQLTEHVRRAVADSHVSNGLCVVSTNHTTCSVMVQEASFDTTFTGLEYLEQDLCDVLETLIPTCRVEGQYRHPGPKLVEFSAQHGETERQTLNTDAHLRSALLGRSESIPVVDGILDLGAFAHVYFVDFDQTRSRDREVSIVVMGETEAAA